MRDAQPPSRSLRPGRPLRSVELVETLCVASPALREARRLHEANFGTLMPHVFMGDVLARVGACMALPGAPDGNEVRSILEALEYGMVSGDPETRGVIGISFASDAQLEPFFDRLAPLLGRRLRAVLERR